MTVTPSYWGAGLWKVMYSIAFNYSDQPTPEQKNAVIVFFNSLKVLIPCDDCKIHYNKLLKQFPVENYLANSNSLKNYVNLLQNKVAVKENKPVVSLQSITAEISKFVVNPTPVIPPKPVPAVTVPVTPQKPVNKGVTFTVNRTPPKPQVKVIPRRGGCNCGKR